MLHHLIGKWVLILYQSDTPSYSSTITLPRPVGKHTRLFNLLSCHGQRIHKRPIGRCPRSGGHSQRNYFSWPVSFPPVFSRSGVFSPALSSADSASDSSATASRTSSSVSFRPFLKPVMALPHEEPNSGRRLGPKTMRATTATTAISQGPIQPGILHSLLRRHTPPPLCAIILFISLLFVRALI